MSTAAPARQAPDRARLPRGPLLSAGGVAVATVALHFRDPHRYGSWGLCPFKALTGLDCPGCGGLRAVNDLSHGQLLQAAHSNLLFVASIPVLVALWALWLRRDLTGAGPRLRPGTARLVLPGLALLALVFTIVRNTPWGSSLYVA